MQLRIKVKSFGNERGTKNKKHGSHQETIGNRQTTGGTF